MPTYFIAPDMHDDGRVVVTGPLHRHLAGALRVRPGETLTLVDGVRVLTAKVASVTDDALTCAVTGETPVPPEPVRLTLAVGYPKGRKLDDIVRQAVELGATRIVPVVTRRSVSRPKVGSDPGGARRGRLAAIALEAAQQSGRVRVPEVTLPEPFERFAARSPEGRGVVLWEDEDAVTLTQALAGAAAPAMTLVVGPEGGLEKAEVEALTARGYRTATLGPHVLRSETACLAALAVAVAALWRPPKEARAALTGAPEGL